MVEQFSLREDADDSRVIGAQIFLRQPQFQLCAGTSDGELLAKEAVAGDSTRGRDAWDAQAFRGPKSFGHEHFDDRRLDAGTEITNRFRAFQRLEVVAQKVSDGGL